MGTFFYGTMFDPVAMPDDILAHVKAIASVKLRRNECFMLSWRYAGAEEQGMTSVWLQPSIPLQFSFDSSAPTRLDPAVLHRLSEAAFSTNGLVIDLPARSLPDEAPADGTGTLQDA
nr:hypothetical protein [Microbacterium lemovicicum]